MTQKHDSSSDVPQPAQSSGLPLIPVWSGRGENLAFRFAIVDPDDYDFIGQWHWRVDRDRWPRAYIDREGGRSRYARMHQLIAGIGIGEYVVDHINGDGFDNRRANLRVITDAQNGQNRTRSNSDSRSGILGVSWDTRDRKWRAALTVNGEQHRLGRYDDKYEAARAVQEGRARLMPYSQEAMRQDAA